MPDMRPETSVIIPTWNRRDLVARAIDSVLAQTREVGEIIVVDDGSTDGTGEVLAQRYGKRITYVAQANAGVSAARNRGLAMAQGRYLALLDSDDVWLPEKTARQAAFLEANPGIGLVLCDVIRVGVDGETIDVFDRRRQIPADGPALQWVLRDPALAPLSVLMRREVYEDVGGFDESLRTAEDLDFHLRVAARWGIGVVSEPLARALRGHDGLSALASTENDYIAVMERAAESAKGAVPEDARRQALATAYVKNAEGCVWRQRYGQAWGLARKAWALGPEPELRRRLRRLPVMAGKRVLRSMLRRAG
ncbi:glycosyltransferase [Luteimonas viscosa]|uniref:Glycosyltransferase n=1 Tax=Luteimonas viscosa TaxID=1132694 RepID=A0A5D4XG11_9GAMM|nr:glycosyltransferase [Luteimonas viscosa]TYT23606.1 glycosyltransferase [Luteimonas viscosa]